MNKLPGIAAAARLAAFSSLAVLLMLTVFPDFPPDRPLSAAAAAGAPQPSAGQTAAIPSGSGDASSVSTGAALSPLPKKRGDEVPAPLQSFVSQLVSKLSEEADFREWGHAERQIYPLGPGTHGWLVKLRSGERDVGYMIITANGSGGYTLSEYGTGTDGIPYSFAKLRAFLAQNELIPSLNASFEAVPLYVPLLPYWKVTVNGQALYINAIVPEILPWDDNKAEAVARSAQAAGRYGLTASGSLSEITAAPIFLTGHPGNPYDNLLWLTSPKLAPLAADEFVQLLEQQPGLVFRSNTGANDILSAPLMITGYQLWTRSAADGGGTVPYAASGIGGRRLVPLGALQASGTFQAYVSGDGEAAH